ncbi:MAG: hypothetical protein J4F40_16180 [Alphaproteobacteria bacterium]|nr:hypothetical protein [Alphaproteobacteria bacterium]
MGTSLCCLTRTAGQDSVLTTYFGLPYSCSAINPAEFPKLGEAPASVAPYGHAVEVDGWLFVTGHPRIDPADNDAPLLSGIENQTRIVFDNLEIVLGRAGYKTRRHRNRPRLPIMRTAVTAICRHPCGAAPHREGTLAPRGDAQTVLTHIVGGGLEDDQRYVVETFLSLACGDIIKPAPRCSSHT